MGPWDKSVMFKSYDEAGVYLGVLDTIFMICYSVGLYLSGWIGERVEVRLSGEGFFSDWTLIVRILQNFN